MAIQTMRGRQARLNISRNGSGRDHYHLVVSRTTGLNGATVTRAFETLAEASAKASTVRDVHVHAGFVATERQNGSVLELSKAGADTGITVKRYLFVRPCNLRHAR